VLGRELSRVVYETAECFSHHRKEESNFYHAQAGIELRLILIHLIDRSHSGTEKNVCWNHWKKAIKCSSKIGSITDSRESSARTFETFLCSEKWNRSSREAVDGEKKVGQIKRNALLVRWKLKLKWWWWRVRCREGKRDGFEWSESDFEAEEEVCGWKKGSKFCWFARKQVLRFSRVSSDFKKVESHFLTVSGVWRTLQS
jgi:hypothetical protein